MPTSGGGKAPQTRHTVTQRGTIDQVTSIMKFHGHTPSLEILVIHEPYLPTVCMRERIISYERTSYASPSIQHKS